jgi:hypothetical protein
LIPELGNRREYLEVCRARSQCHRLARRMGTFARATINFYTVRTTAAVLYRALRA